MPQFKDPKNSALSGLNKAKKRVLKNEKIQYGQLQPDQVPADDTFGEVASSAPKSRSSSSAGGIAGLLSELESLINEVVQTNNFFIEESGEMIDTLDSIPKPTSVIKDTGPSATAIVNIVKRISTLLASANYDFRNKLTQPELDSAISNLKSISKTMVANDRIFRRADRPLRGRDDLDDANRRAYLALVTALERVQLRWRPGLNAMYNDLHSALVGAKQDGRRRVGGRMLGADGHGIRHVESVFGGILNALRGDGELLTMGYVGRQPLVPLSQSHAPRNTMDLVNLPRRFL
jgi:hypothetical protein